MLCARIKYSKKETAQSCGVCRCSNVKYWRCRWRLRAALSLHVLPPSFPILGESFPFPKISPCSHKVRGGERTGKRTEGDGGIRERACELLCELFSLRIGPSLSFVSFCISTSTSRTVGRYFSFGWSPREAAVPAASRQCVRVCATHPLYTSIDPGLETRSASHITSSTHVRTPSPLCAV